MAFVDAAKLLISSAIDGVELVELPTGKSLAKNERIRDVRSLSVSPDKAKVAIVTGQRNPGRIEVYDIGLQGRLADLGACDVSNDSRMLVKFSPDGQHLFFMDPAGVVRMVQVATGMPVDIPRVVAPLNAPALLTADGKRFIHAGPVHPGTGDRQALIYSVPAFNDPEPTFWHSRWGTIFASDLDVSSSEVIASIGHLSLVLWDLKQKKQISALMPLGDGELRGVHWLPDARHLLLHSSPHTITVWDTVENKHRFPRSALRSTVRSFSLSPDAKTVLIVTARGELATFNLETEKLEHTSRSLARTAHVVAARWLDTGDLRVLWEPTRVDTISRTTFQITQSFEFPENAPLVGEGFLSFDGKVVVRASRDGNWFALHAHDLTEWKGFPTKDKAARVLAVNGDGSLALGLREGAPLLWRPGTNDAHALANQKFTNVKSAALSRDGTVAAISDQRTLAVFNTQGNPNIRRLSGPAISIAAISPSNSLLAGGVGEKLVIFDIENMRFVLQLTGHVSEVTTALFVPDERRVFSGGADACAILWDLPAALGEPTTDESELPIETRLAHADGAIAFRAALHLQQRPDELNHLITEAIERGKAAKKWRELIAKLDDEDLRVREQSHLELERNVARAGPFVQAAIADAAGEKLDRLKSLARLAGPATQPAASLDRKRCILPLRWANTPHSRRLLEAYAQDDEPLLVSTAKTALLHLESRRASLTTVPATQPASQPSTQPDR
jgi:WD40 repeat protein